ncbi:Slp family lipoprotein [Thiohalomonas denitrificans]|uniref:Slp family lipoprotein n=1 Tax=Thiohalomonas denitrificans TaxID=415747 RepID=UPI0026F026F3|nr:Slp family lipoprotein [Thiohalomonas denitrificans]
MKRLLLLAAVLTLGACATQVPERIQTAPAGNPPVAEVRSNPERFEGSRVRWGGTIANVQNRADETLIQIVARDLTDAGKPKEEDRSSGRFIARIDGFVDPAVYTQGRRLTVTGEIVGSRVEPVGEYEYRFPVVEVEASYLWPRETESVRRPYYYDPFWDPFWYDPWYPYRPFGYRPYYW